MERLIAVQQEYASLSKIERFLKKETSLKVSQEYDAWEVRTDKHGQMEKCIILKKSSMHALRIYFDEENTLKVNHIIPNKLMNAYFGKNKEEYQSILNIITGKIKELALAKSQNRTFEEMVEVFSKISI